MVEKRPWLMQALALCASLLLIAALQMSYDPFIAFLRALPEERIDALYPLLSSFTLTFFLSAAAELFVPLLWLFTKIRDEKLRLNWPWLAFWALVLLLLIATKLVDINYSKDAEIWRSGCGTPNREKTEFEQFCALLDEFVRRYTLGNFYGGFFCAAFLILPADKRKWRRFLRPFAALAVFALLSWLLSKLPGDFGFQGFWWPCFVVLELLSIGLMPSFPTPATGKKAAIVFGACALTLLLLYCASRLLASYQGVAELPYALRALWAHNRLLWQGSTSAFRSLLLFGLLPLAGVQVGLMLRSGFTKAKERRPE
ncbi:MAG: hypothetical protein LBD02_04295 [Christensenellaceae bacterium]|jgi:hypothetical protein|nr:hypothetical protein [Christensenellaceae bacterium]